MSVESIQYKLQLHSWIMLTYYIVITFMFHFCKQKNIIKVQMLYSWMFSLWYDNHCCKAAARHRQIEWNEPQSFQSKIVFDNLTFSHYGSLLSSQSIGLWWNHNIRVVNRFGEWCYYDAREVWKQGIKFFHLNSLFRFYFILFYNDTKEV